MQAFLKPSGIILSMHSTSADYFNSAVLICFLFYSYIISITKVTAHFQRKQLCYTCSYMRKMQVISYAAARIREKLHQLSKLAGSSESAVLWDSERERQVDSTRQLLYGTDNRKTDRQTWRETGLWTGSSRGRSLSVRSGGRGTDVW